MKISEPLAVEWLTLFSSLIWLYFFSSYGYFLPHQASTFDQLRWYRVEKCRWVGQVLLRLFPWCVKYDKAYPPVSRCKRSRNTFLCLMICYQNSPPEAALPITASRYPAFFYSGVLRSKSFLAQKTRRYIIAATCQIPNPLLGKWMYKSRIVNESIRIAIPHLHIVIMKKRAPWVSPNIHLSQWFLSHSYWYTALSFFADKNASSLAFY